MRLLDEQPRRRGRAVQPVCGLAEVDPYVAHRRVRTCRHDQHAVVFTLLEVLGRIVGIGRVQRDRRHLVDPVRRRRLARSHGRRIIRDHAPVGVIGRDPARLLVDDDAGDLGPDRFRGQRDADRLAGDEGRAGVQLGQELVVHVKPLAQLLHDRGVALRGHRGLFGVVRRDAFDQPLGVGIDDRVVGRHRRVRIGVKQVPDVGVHDPVLRQAVPAFEGKDRALAHPALEAVHHARRHARSVEQDLDPRGQRRLPLRQVAAGVFRKLDILRIDVRAGRWRLRPGRQRQRAERDQAQRSRSEAGAEELRRRDLNRGWHRDLHRVRHHDLGATFLVGSIACRQERGRGQGRGGVRPVNNP